MSTQPTVKLSGRDEKWCSGSCGRLLPLSEFWTNTEGRPQGRCKGCHRVVARESYHRSAYARRVRERRAARARRAA